MQLTLMSKKRFSFKQNVKENALYRLKLCYRIYQLGLLICLFTVASGCNGKTCIIEAKPVGATNQQQHTRDQSVSEIRKKFEKSNFVVPTPANASNTPVLAKKNKSKSERNIRPPFNRFYTNDTLAIVPHSQTQGKISLKSSTTTLNLNDLNNESTSGSNCKQKLTSSPIRSTFSPRFLKIKKQTNIDISSPSINIDKTEQHTLNFDNMEDITHEIENKINQFNALEKLVEIYQDNHTIDSNQDGYKLVFQPLWQELSLFYGQAMKFIPVNDATSAPMVTPYSQEETVTHLQNMGHLLARVRKNVTWLVAQSGTEIKGKSALTDEENQLFNQMLSDALQQKEKEKKCNLDITGNNSTAQSGTMIMISPLNTRKSHTSKKAKKSSKIVIVKQIPPSDESMPKN